MVSFREKKIFQNMESLCWQWLIQCNLWRWRLITPNHTVYASFWQLTSFFLNTEDSFFILAFNIYAFTDLQPSFLSGWFITCSRLYVAGTQNYRSYQKEKTSILSPSPEKDATFNLMAFVTLVSFLTQSALGFARTQSSKAFSTCLSLSMCLTSLD